MVFISCNEEILYTIGYEPEYCNACAFDKGVKSQALPSHFKKQPRMGIDVTSEVELAADYYESKYREKGEGS